jgi:cytochrome c556
MRSKSGLVAVSALLLLTFHLEAHAALRRLVSDMLENLASVNLIERGFALDDMDDVKRGAEDIVRRTEAMRKISSIDLSIDGMRRPAFDSYIDKLVSHANALVKAADKEKTEKAIDAFRNMMEEGCLPCHRAFRDEGSTTPPAVFLMVSLVTGLQEINRGLLLNDYRLVETRAREVQDAARVMLMDPVIEYSFQIEPAERKTFKKFARKLDKSAREIESAAEEGDHKSVLKGVQTMLQESCIPCHFDFR